MARRNGHCSRKFFLLLGERRRTGQRLLNRSRNPVATDVTQILQAWSEGDQSAPERLMPMVYQELRRLAGDYLRRERPDHTLQATALVHEAYLKLVDQNRVDWKNRAHFCGVAAQLMRRVLMEHARAHNAAKRGGKMEKLYLDETRELAQERAPDLVALDDALKSLATTFPRESKVVELKFFGGLEAKEIAEVLQVSTKTVLRDWNFAKLWLCRALTNAA
jgi:RNA polymerase sigma-70 factor, ECF subfamily